MHINELQIELIDNIMTACARHREGHTNAEKLIQNIQNANYETLEAFYEDKKLEAVK